MYCISNICWCYSRSQRSDVPTPNNSICPQSPGVMCAYHHTVRDWFRRPATGSQQWRLPVHRAPASDWSPSSHPRRHSPRYIRGVWAAIADPKCSIDRCRSGSIRDSWHVCTFCYAIRWVANRLLSLCFFSSSSPRYISAIAARRHSNDGRNNRNERRPVKWQRERQIFTNLSKYWYTLNSRCDASVERMNEPLSQSECDFLYDCNGTLLPMPIKQIWPVYVYRHTEATGTSHTCCCALTYPQIYSCVRRSCRRYCVRRSGSIYRITWCAYACACAYIVSLYIYIPYYVQRILYYINFISIVTLSQLTISMTERHTCVLSSGYNFNISWTLSLVYTSLIV